MFVLHDVYRFRCRPLHLLAVLFVATVLLSCQTAHPPAPAPPHPQTGQKPSIRVQDLEQRIHDLINRERAAHGLSPLGLDDALSRIARGHSRDMAKRSYFDHYSPEGRDFSFRYLEQGYACAIRTGNTIHLGAENIALIHLYSSVTTINGVPYYDWNSLEQIAGSTVQGWMNSSGHRKNILTPHWMNQGIGIFITSDGTVYVTQNFC
jgi:uncharacterized protein YkwD